MKYYKKFLSLVLMGLLMVSLSACGAHDDTDVQDNNKKNAKVTEQVSKEDKTKFTATPTPKTDDTTIVEPTVTVAPTDEAEPTETPTVLPTPTSEGTLTPTSRPTVEPTKVADKDPAGPTVTVTKEPTKTTSPTPTPNEPTPTVLVTPTIEPTPDTESVDMIKVDDNTYIDTETVLERPYKGLDRIDRVEETVEDGEYVFYYTYSLKSDEDLPIVAVTRDLSELVDPDAPGEKVEISSLEGYLGMLYQNNYAAFVEIYNHGGLNYSHLDIGEKDGKTIYIFVAGYKK